MTNERGNPSHPPVVTQAAYHWTARRGVEQLDNSLALMDITVYGRQESWEDSPPGWPQACTNTRTMDGPPTWTPVPEWPAGRPLSQWPRLSAGHSDNLTQIRR